MKCNFSTKLYGWFYHSSCKKEIKKNCKRERTNIKAIKKEYISIILRAKDIGNSKLLSAYCMSAYFISICRMTKMPPDEAYAMFKDALYANRLFHIAMGDAESYLNPKRMPERKQWEKDSHLHKYENDWVVVVLDKTDQYDLGYDYHDCGICKLCQDEGCFELAKYLCQLDFVMADMMGLSLKRTQTIAEGAKYCDFRYSKKQ